MRKSAKNVLKVQEQISPTCVSYGDHMVGQNIEFTKFIGLQKSLNCLFRLNCLIHSSMTCSHCNETFFEEFKPQFMKW